MTEILKQLSDQQKFNDYIKNVKNNTAPVILSGLTDVSKNLFIYSTEEILKRPVCIITYNEIQAKNIVKDLRNLLKDKGEIVYFPKREIMSYDYEAQSKDVFAERIRTLNKIYSKRANIIVTTIEAVSQKMISKEELYKNVLELKIGKRYNLENIKQTLVALGYERFDLIEGKGQFGVRGGIVDVAISSEKGVRIEFFDDEVDSIRYFNIQSQRSTEMIDEISIYPAYEFALERSLEDIVKDIKTTSKKVLTSIKERQEEDIEEILQGDYINKVDRYFNSFYQKQAVFLDYLENDTVIFLDEIEKIKARIENIKNDTENIIKLLIEKEKIVPDALKTLGDFYDFYAGDSTSSLNNKVIIHLLREEVVGEKEAIFNRRTFSAKNLIISESENKEEKEENFTQNSPSPMERNSKSRTTSTIWRTKT